ncbi:MAG: Ig-like domain-containing protein [Caldilineaceae bacterium]|nr:Ig-like domain-containing protein [Caldilineaceae bacterium]
MFLFINHQGIYSPLRWLHLVLFIAVGSFLQPTLAYAMPPAEPTGTVISQDITTATTWTKAGSPYQVTQFIRVRPNVTLTVEPGVEVVFHSNTSLRAEGALIAQGTANEPVLFTGASKQPGAWNGITASNTAEQLANLKFDHVIVEYAIYVGMENYGNLDVNYAMAAIRNSTFRFGGGNGLTVSGNATATIADSAFHNNTLAALRIGFGAQQAPVLSNLTASGNGTLNAVVFAAGTLAKPLTLAKMGLPYAFKGGFTVAKSGHLTLAPGIEVQVDTGFSVNGTLTAVGTAAEPILITGIKKQPGGWWGLDIHGDYQQVANATLAHVIIEYGGRGTDAYDANLSISAANVAMTNSTIRHSSHHAVLNDGGSPEQPFAVTIANSTIQDNPGDAVTCSDESCNMTLTNLTVTNNGRNGIVYRTAIGGDQVWPNIGLPYYVEGQGGVAMDGALTIEPGVEVRMAQDAIFHVNGTLSAVGTPEQPIRFIGTQAQPGWWQRIQVDHEGFAELKDCEIAYGGGQTQGFLFGQLHLNTSAAFVSDCTIHHSASAGVSVAGGALPILIYNRIEANVAGMTANFALTQVDARFNWWGAASGPTHASNPGGTGQSVSDNILYQPWLASPDEHTATAGLTINIVGPGRFSPGDTVLYSAIYRNPTAESVENAVVRMALPANASLEAVSSGGIFWPQRNQVFWKLGQLTPGKGGALYVKVRYDWGLTDGLKSTVVAQLSGTNIHSPRFTVQPYLEYVPRTLATSADLTGEQLQAERSANPALEQLYQQAAGDGFIYANAERHTYSTGETEVEVTLLRFQPQFASFRLSLVNGKVVGIMADGSSYTVYRGQGALRYDRQSNAWSAVAPNNVQAAATTIDWGECMENCIAEKLPGYVIKKYIKALSDASKAISCVSAANDTTDTGSVLGCAKYLKKIAPGASEAIDLGQCNLDCQICEESGQGCSNPNCHCCKEDSVRCDANDSLYGIFGIEVIKRRKCDIPTGEEYGRYFAEVVERVCAVCEKCVNNGADMACVAKNGGFLQQANQAFAAMLNGQLVSDQLDALASRGDLACEDCVLAKDPNELYGPTGDLLPGQLVTYTIAYENVGAGNAVGVFMVNKLDPAFDLTTLTIQGDARVSKNARTIFWTIGDLAPKGEPGSTGTVSYSVRLRSDLPSGTLLSNGAVVHFPSVPEETPTNVLINLIQPLVAEPQTLDATIGQPLAITLNGYDAIHTPLTYRLVEAPAYGMLTGTAPHLIYTPAASAVGGDRLRFTVSNGVTTSPPTAITIRVAPAPADKVGPTIRWTAPAQGETVVLVAAAALQGDELAYYYPVIQVQFSEALRASSVNSTTILVQDGASQLVAADVRYDGQVQQAVLMLRQPPQNGMDYTVTVTPGVTDLMGNAVALYHWNFQVARELQAPQGNKLYLPMVMR